MCQETGEEADAIAMKTNNSRNKNQPEHEVHMTKARQRHMQLTELMYGA